MSTIRDRLKKSVRYWDRKFREASQLPLSVDLGGVPEYAYYEDRLQKKAIALALRFLNVNLKEARLLDVGCGRGRLSFWFAEFGAHVCGIDISLQAISKAVKLAQQNNSDGLDFLVYDGLHFPFRDSSFDVVNMTAVLPAVEKIGLTKEIVREMTRVCKINGLIFILELVKNFREDNYRKLVPEDKLIHLLKTNGANLVLSRGIYVDKLRFYLHYLNRFKVASRILKHFIPIILIWSRLIDEHLTFLSKYAEKKLFVFMKS